VTSRNLFSSDSVYIRSTVALDHRIDGVLAEFSCSDMSSGATAARSARTWRRCPGRFGVGRSILILTSSPPAAGSPVDHVLAVGGADDDDVLQALHPVDLRQQLRHDRVLHVGGTPEPRVRKIESISSKNTMTGMPSLAFSLAR